MSQINACYFMSSHLGCLFFLTKSYLTNIDQVVSHQFFKVFFNPRTLVAM